MSGPDRDERIATLLDALSIEEQVLLLAGQDFWSTVPIERLGIPSIKVSDGPNGVRGGGALVGGVKAAAFPVEIALAATWNVGLVSEVGAALADEAKSKGARVLLAPTINIHRSTLNGRNFECFSEDAYLTAELAVAYVGGLQGRRIAATVKHFIGNESEYQRNTISSDIDVRTLQEIYLPPFEAAVKRGGAWALMASYNRLNGTYVSERAELIQGLLKTDWAFDGVVMSDWFGTRSTIAAMAAGLDLEMPGPGRYRRATLLAAYEAGGVPAAALRASARRLLGLIDRVGAFDDPAIPAERAEDRPATRALIRRAGSEAIVLLKNDGVLPLEPRTPRRIAVIGPNASTAQIMGGGSAQLNPHYSVSPFDGLRAALPPETVLEHEIGCANHRLVPLHEGPVAMEFFDGTAFSGPVKHAMSAPNAVFMFLGEETPGFSARDFSVRVRFTVVPEQSGLHAIGVIASGPCRLLVDGASVVDAWVFRPGQEYFGAACDEVVETLALQAGIASEIVIEMTSSTVEPTLDLTVLRVGLAPVIGDEALARAVDLAKRSDLALVFAGLTGEWDGEGRDRTQIALSGRQDELIATVAAANRRTIVVLQTGCPVTMPWLADVQAVMQAWYPGQEAGHAIADVLLGTCDPGGRLPQTFPQRLQDDPTFINYPGENGHVRYGEGIFVGYRYYEKKQVQPLFPFGFGLSYTSFRLGDLRLSSDRVAPGEMTEASVEVTNTGRRAGSTVVQFYVADRASSAARPDKELKGFAKLDLAPGETGVATASLDPRALAFYDTARRAWLAEAGEFEVRVGFSSVDIRAKAPLILTGDWTDAPALPAAPGISPIPDLARRNT